MLPLRSVTPRGRLLPPPRRHLGLVSAHAPAADRGMQVWLDTGILTVGSAWIPPTGFRFCDRAEAVNSVFLFPRGCVWVRSGDRMALADATTVVHHHASHSYASADPGQSARVDWFAFAPQVLRELTGPWCMSDSRALDHGFCGSRDYRLQRLLLLEASLTDPLAEEEAMLRLVAGILERAHRSAKVRGQSGHGSRALALVERTRLAMALGLYDAPSLERLGREVSSSVFHLCRTFKGVTGTTVHRYLTELRLRASLELVAVPRSSLASTALDLSFATHSHFTAAFRRAFGETPSEFRNRVWEAPGVDPAWGAVRSQPPSGSMSRAHALQRVARHGSSSRSTPAKRL